MRTAVVGCGLIGKRRAQVAAANVGSKCVLVVDSNIEVARALAKEVGAESSADWREAVRREDIDALVVATPNGFLAEISIAAAAHGKHVLAEKPMGRTLEEAEHMRAAFSSAGRILKIGLNHRYHPAIAEAHRQFARREIGDVINIRCRYGHGGRPGYEKEWRGNRELSGGGELTDQGVHVVDLIHWFAGQPFEVFSYLQTAVWPLGDLEDNAFGLMRFESGAIATLHTSWTQWKNLFSLEIHGTHGALCVEGLGRSYGIETLVRHIRKPEGGAPETSRVEYPGEDRSWELEWEDLLGSLAGGRAGLGSAEDGVAAMRTLEAMYRSAATGQPVELAGEVAGHA